MWSCGLVESHDDGNHVFTVENGRSQNVPGLVVCEFIHKGAEVLVLKGEKTYMRHLQM